MPPRAIIPGLLGKRPVFLLALVRNRANVLSVTFVNDLGSEQPLFGRRITNIMVYANSADALAILRHVDNEAIIDTARTAGLVVNRLDCRGDDLEVVVSLEGFVHLRLVPQLFEKTCYDAEEGRNLGEQLVCRAGSYSYGEKAIRAYFRASCHSVSPRSVLDRPAQVQRREDPGRLLQDSDPVLPHLELF